MLHKFFALACLFVLSMSPVGAQDEPNALVKTLSLLPDSPALRSALVSYADFATVAPGQPGGPQGVPADAGIQVVSPYANLAPFAQATLSASPDEFATTNGFAFSDIQQVATAGQPPQQIEVYRGDYDVEAVQAALMTHDYAVSDEQAPALLCWVEGCDQGMKLNIADRDALFAFGGSFGQHHPLALTADAILTSPDAANVEALRLVYRGDSDSLYDAPDIRVMVDALAARDGVVRGASFVPASAAGLDPAAMLNLVSPDQQSALSALNFGTLPLPVSIGLVDMPTADAEYSYVLLSYGDADTAQTALDELLHRFEQVPSLAAEGATLKSLLEGRGASLTEHYVYQSDAGADSAAVIVFENPQPQYDVQPGDDGRLILLKSGQVYQLMLNMLYRRDMLWFVSSLDLPSSD